MDRALASQAKVPSSNPAPPKNIFHGFFKARKKVGKIFQEQNHAPFLRLQQRLQRTWWIVALVQQEFQNRSIQNIHLTSYIPIKNPNAGAPLPLITYLISLISGN